MKMASPHKEIIFQSLYKCLLNTLKLTDKLSLLPLNHLQEDTEVAILPGGDMEVAIPPMEDMVAPVTHQVAVVDMEVSVVHQATAVDMEALHLVAPPVMAHHHKRQLQ